MNWKQMKALEPEFARLEQSAENAGRHSAEWVATWLAMTEPLSKIVGHGCINEQLRNAAAYEVCRAGIFAAWSRGTKSEPVDATDDAGTFPWEAGWGTAHDDAVEAPVEQTTFIDTSEAYT